VPVKDGTIQASNFDSYPVLRMRDAERRCAACASQIADHRRSRGDSSLRSIPLLLTIGRTKMMNERPKSFGQLQCRESDGQVKTSWPGASRIKIEHTANSLDPRPMRVAGNDHVNSAGYGIQLEFIDIV
jgi:hypothetical protein